jgi:hypothetical protein
MPSTEHLKKGEVTTVLDLSVLIPIVESDILNLSFVEILLTWPLKSIGPSLVTKPVANEISITSIDQDWNLLKDTWHKTVERLHPITLEEEVAVDVEITAVVTAYFNTEFLLNSLLVQKFADPAKGRITKVARILAWTADIVNILKTVSVRRRHKKHDLTYLSSSLIRTYHSVVAVDACGDTRPNTLTIIAVLDEALAARKSVGHSLAFTIVKDSWVTTLSTSHWLIVLVLSKTISETVTNQNRLEVDVTFLVSQDLGSENRNVVTSVRLASNMEVLLRILGELFEEEREKSVNVLASGNGVAHRTPTIRIANIDRLIKENHRGICVPRVWIVDEFEVFVN